MASIRYRIKTNKPFNSIYIRFKHGTQFDIEISTGIKAPKNKFSNTLQRINSTDLVDYKKLNSKLRNLKNHIQNQYSKDSIEDTIINNQWLKQIINDSLNKDKNVNTFNVKVYLSDFMQLFINEAKQRLNSSNNPIKPRTIKHYETTKSKIKAYEKYKGEPLKLSKLNLSFHQEFIEFLETHQKLNPNTIGGYVDVIKLVCRKAELKSYDVHSSYKTSEFYTPSNKAIDTYLTLDEIRKIKNHPFKFDYLDNTRDWLIISVWTGLRISDLLNLNKSNIDGDFIKKDTLKTDFPVIIPVHNHVKAILSKRNGNFPRKISDQKYNIYIKEVCRQSGITKKIKGAKLCPVKINRNGKNVKIHRKITGKYPKYQLISSHIGRRSFATNHYGKIDTLTLMKITGHKTEKQFLEYIKITPMEYAKKLKEYWNNINFNLNYN